MVKFLFVVFFFIVARVFAYVLPYYMVNKDAYILTSCQNRQISIKTVVINSFEIK